MNVAKALKGRGADVGITMIARSVNSMGLGIMGGGSLEEALTELVNWTRRRGGGAGKTICIVTLPLPA